MTWLALELAYVGLATLALAMDRHHRQVRGQVTPVPLRWSLRFAGAACLAGALVVCVRDRGPWEGPVMLLGVLSAAGLVAVLLLAYAPRAAAWLAALASVAAVATGAVAGF